MAGAAASSNTLESSGATADTPGTATRATPAAVRPAVPRNPRLDRSGMGTSSSVQVRSPATEGSYGATLTLG